ncbi:phage-like element PBSX protein XkdS [Geomicrobium sp. JCM 19037]|uniref:DUF2634 domain-containing protein n=1 Tax=Geomicrobium sp. JCM 19037 TaxID=1460634 RepID=UPI00045F1EE1|nr:DUF2634 domain-containing protein [Geomicrobium sp. JCM 19037]GAK03245.1 phage-like element PBSX protein XkdS [Geomicrobium sp. JCM 19037]
MAPLTPDNEPIFLDDIMAEQEAAEDTIQTSRTYHLNFAQGRICRPIDGEPAIRQYIRKALGTARDRYAIYDEDYGNELYDLLGATDTTDALLESEIPRMLREALIYDDRIESVTINEINRQQDAVYVNLSVATVDGLFIDEEVTL